MTNPYHDKITERYLTATDFLTQRANRMILDILYEGETMSPEKIFRKLGDEDVVHVTYGGFVNKLKSLKKAGWVAYESDDKIGDVSLTAFGIAELKAVYENQKILEEAFL